VRTVYRHNVRSASANRAKVDIYIDRIELYEDGRFYGEVYYVPDRLSRVTATIHRNGRVTFDRNVFLVGDPYSGFEIVSTRHYDSFILNAFRIGHGYRVGVLNLRNGSVVETTRSGFMEANHFAGHVPISLLPEDTGWLFDFGSESFSGYYFGNNETYYYGYEDGQYDDMSYENNGLYFDRQDAPGDDAVYQGSYLDRQGEMPELEFRTEDAPDQVIQLERSNQQHFRTQEGAEIDVKRETQLERIG